MDHLPHIEDPAFPALEIPYLGSHCQYDGDGLREFPFRQGWRLAGQEGYSGPSLFLDRIDGGPKTSTQKTSFIQAWLFFGLLIEVLRIVGVEIDTRMLVDETDEAQALVSTKQLPRCIAEWRDRELRLPIKEQEAHLRLTIQVLNEMGEIVDNLLSFPWIKLDQGNAESLALAVVAQSISIMGDTLTNTSRRIWTFWERLATRDPRYRLRKRFAEPAVLSIERLKQNGWCKSERMMLRQYTDSTGLFLASLLKRDAMIGNHDRCSTYACVAMQIDEATYKPRHTVEGCLCGIVTVEGVLLTDILRNGGIPCVQLSVVGNDNNEEHLKIRVCEGRSGEYVAFSHVWAHGLGNPAENGLPFCQLQRLQRLALALVQHPDTQTPRGDHFASSHGLDSEPRPISIWIDTLCIPVSKAFTDARKLAILRLTDTFRNAAKVLVLDAELQAVSTGVSAPEMELRLLTCSWMRRVWTLQEALESRPGNLHWQFKDMPLKDSALFSGISSAPFDSTYKIGLEQRIPKALRSGEEQGQSLDTRFLSAMNSLRYRTTSKMEDETLCLAPILLLERQLLLSTNDATERMKIFLSMWQQIPDYFIFLEGARIEQEGCSWMPQSFIQGSHKSVIQRTDTKMTTFDSRGIFVSYPGLLIKSPDELQYIRFEIGFRNPLDGQWCALRDTGPIFENILPGSQRWKTWREQLCRLAHPALVVEFPSIEASAYLIAVLVNISAESDGVLYAKHLCRVRLLPRILQSDEHDIEQVLKREYDLKVAELTTDQRGRDRGFKSAPGLLETTGANQRWCIG